MVKFAIEIPQQCCNMLKPPLTFKTYQNQACAKDLLSRDNFWHQLLKVSSILDAHGPS